MKRRSEARIVFDAAPEALDQDIVAPRASAVHADRDLALDEHVGEDLRGELAALVGVEDLGLAMPGHRLLQGFDAERGLHRDRQAPG